MITQQDIKTLPWIDKCKSVPVMRSVPVWFHLVARTAPACASTLFSIRPVRAISNSLPAQQSTQTCIIQHA